MTSEARTPGVSPAQIEKALDEANREIFALTGAGVATMAAVSSALRNLIRAAQVEALESVAKEMCCGCKRGREVHFMTAGRVVHPPLGPLCWSGCDAGPIQLELARLRQSASASKETE